MKLNRELITYKRAELSTREILRDQDQWHRHNGQIIAAIDTMPECRRQQSYSGA